MLAVLPGGSWSGDCWPFDVGAGQLAVEERGCDTVPENGEHGRQATPIRSRHDGNRVFYSLADEHARTLVTRAVLQAQHAVDDQPAPPRGLPHERERRTAVTGTPGPSRTQDQVNPARDQDDDTHGHSHPKGFKGWWREVFVPHSHDASDAIDDALEASSQGIRAVKVSLVLLALTAGTPTGRYGPMST